MLWLIAQQHCCSGLKILKVGMSDLSVWFQKTEATYQLTFKVLVFSPLFRCLLSWHSEFPLPEVVVYVCLKGVQMVQPCTTHKAGFTIKCIMSYILSLSRQSHDWCFFFKVLTFYIATYLCCFHSHLSQSSTNCMQGASTSSMNPRCSSEYLHDDTPQMNWNLYK